MVISCAAVCSSTEVLSVGARQLCANMKKLLDLQQNERVQVQREHVIDVKFHGDDDDDSD